jgi:hypothetical protein
MAVYKPLRLSLFIYDLIRLVIMLEFLRIFAPPGNPGGAGTFPYLVFAAANALYPLMSLFLWLKCEAYTPYLPLYAAGKLIAAAAALAWFFVSAPGLAGALAVPAFNLDLVIIVMDTGSACGALLLKKKISPAPAGTFQEGL